MTITIIPSGDDVITGHQVDEFEADGAASGAMPGSVVLKNPSHDGGQGGAASSTPAVELLEDVPVDVVVVPALVVHEVNGALTKEAPATDGDEARSSKVPSCATWAKGVTGRSRCRTKGKRTSKSPRRRSYFPTSRK